MTRETPSAVLDTPAYTYASDVVHDRLTDCYGRPTKAPRYVKKQARVFLRVADGKDKRWTISDMKVRQIRGILDLMIMPKGLKAGAPFSECMLGYQWLTVVAVLCTVSREDPNKRRYERLVLELGRKSYKTYTCGILFILLLLTEPRFSKFYSVAPDGALSREVYDAISTTIKSSPALYKWKDTERFSIRRDYISFIPLESTYYPLAYTTSRFDGKLPTAWLSDETAALRSEYPLESMASGQINIKNKLGMVISTQYPTKVNPFTDELDYAKKVLDGLVDDETVFALLYEPDRTKAWMTDDEILRQANPASLVSEEIWEDLIKKRTRAIEMPSARENFLTKHCNIVYSGGRTESYIQIEAVRACKVEEIDWTGREVYLGLDLSISTDNTCVAMVAMDEDGKILATTHTFIPEGRIEEKDREEKLRYEDFIEAGICTACGDKTIDYAVVEKYITDIEETYGVTVVAVGYDVYNAISTAQKLSDKYSMVQIKQHSSVLHAPTKFLKEHILEGNFAYTDNRILEINFENAVCDRDANMGMYIHKRKSRGKVDSVIALIDAVYLLQQEELNEEAGFVIQT